MNRKYRKTLIIGNWKMNMLASEVKPFMDALKTAMPKVRTCGVALCVPFPLIPALAKASKEGRVSVGAQNVSNHEKGAYTGEVSMAQLLDLGVKYVIVGHSERREYYFETDELVRDKAKAILDAGITPIICVGETLAQREGGLTMEFVSYQVKAALSGLTPDQIRRVVIAYEPIWAIGTGKTATEEEANEVCAEIRTVIRRITGARIARGVSILYGGSMNAANAEALLSMTDIDGGLIGGASLKPEDFSKIIEATAQ